MKIAEKDTDLNIRCGAINTIGFMFNKRAALRLRRMLKNKTEPDEVRASAAEALANIGDRKSLPLLLASTYDPSPVIRFWACYGLGQMPDRKSLPRLKALIENDETRIERWGSICEEAKESTIAIMAHYLKNSQNTRNLEVD